MTNAAMYLRVSLDATGEQLAVTRQREDCLKIAEARGWAVVEEYADNSISASDAGKVRPGYDKLCRDYEFGRFDALICWDLDRLTRQPRQLEDWIDRAEQRGLRLVTANGEADLGTDGGRMYARIKAAVARAEVERKGARQARAQRQRAELGRPPAGVRLTGYTRHGEVVPAEADLVRRMFNRFSAGDSLYGIAAGLQEDGVTTRRGGTWNPSSIRTILTNGRYAGRSTLKGETVGAASWPAIVSEAQFDAVQARLNDPRRVVNHHDTARKYLGSGVYECECGLPVRSTSSQNGSGHRYACKNWCYKRTGEAVDQFVVAVVRERLSRPDLADLLAKEADQSELAKLAAERAELQDRLRAIEADYDDGLIDGRRFKAAVEKVEARLADVQRQQVGIVAAEGPASVLGAADPVAAFDSASLDVKRNVIRFLVQVTLHPMPRGRKGFDPESVTITARAQ